MLILFLLSSYGLAWFLVNSPLADPLVDWLSNISFFNELFSCIVCTSFWCGLALSYSFFDKQSFLMAAVHGLAVLGFSAIILEIFGEN